MARLFGTDGVRGIANDELTPELAFSLGEAAGALLPMSGRGHIVVGRDTRLSGAMLESALVAGLAAAGCDALLAGIVPTPAVALLVRELGADGGAVISASHNPAAYNGIKFFGRDGFKLPDETESRIEDFVVAGSRSARPTGAGVGTAAPISDAIDRYVAHAIATVPGRLDGLSVALDCGHGAAARTTELAFRGLGAAVTPINCDWSGLDINDGCGSTDLTAVTRLVLETGADLGIAHDGDADRVLAVDETGMEIDGDRIMAICAAHSVGTPALPGDHIVGTVMANLGFTEAMRGLGITVDYTQVGDRWVLERMRETGAALGGEQSGHVIFLQHTTTGDGLITALQLARTMHETGKPLSELARVMRRFPQVLINVHVRDRAALGTNAAVGQAVSDAEAALGSSGRILVRASGTEPLVRVMVEASDETVAQQLASQVAAVVEREL